MFFFIVELSKKNKSKNKFVIMTQSAKVSLTHLRFVIFFLNLLNQKIIDSPMINLFKIFKIN